jgi:hypothetical protein
VPETVSRGDGIGEEVSVIYVETLVVVDLGLRVEVRVDEFELSRVVGIVASDSEGKSTGRVVVSVQDLDEAVTGFLA